MTNDTPATVKITTLLLWGTINDESDGLFFPDEDDTLSIENNMEWVRGKLINMGKNENDINEAISVMKANGYMAGSIFALPSLGYVEIGLYRPFPLTGIVQTS